MRNFSGVLALGLLGNRSGRALTATFLVVGCGGAAMSAAADVRPALLGHLQDLHLTRRSGSG
jgi:hypothetical protein